MKFKQFCALVLVVLCPLLLLVGCKGRNVSTPAIVMSRYLESSVISNYSSSSKKTLALSSFIADTPNTNADYYKNHTSLTFSANLAWIYGMYVECIYFYYYCNGETNVENLVLTMTALDGDTTDSSLTSGTYKVERNLAFTTTKQKGVLVRVDIKQTVVSNSSNLANCTITLTEKDEHLLSNNSFAWTIYGMQIYGEHRG